jgi:hypothetical protein
MTAELWVLLVLGAALGGPAAVALFELVRKRTRTGGRTP